MPRPNYLLRDNISIPNEQAYFQYTASALWLRRSPRPCPRCGTLLLRTPVGYVTARSTASLRALETAVYCFHCPRGEAEAIIPETIWALRILWSRLDV